MRRKLLLTLFLTLVVLVSVLVFKTPFRTNSSSQSPGFSPSLNYIPMIADKSQKLTIILGEKNKEYGLYLHYGGDVDTEVVKVGSPPREARRTGNGAVLPTENNDPTPDYYMQIEVNDNAVHAGSPTSRLIIEVEYFDLGTDTFFIQYDALSGGPYGDGTFKSSGMVTKTNTKTFKVVKFYLCDAYFANRTNGGDFRLTDNGDGAEIISRITIRLQGNEPKTINVDSCGADPWDTMPDSDAIQACADMACPGDTVTFTSGVAAPGYQGYMIDKTIFMVGNTAKSDITFTSTDSTDRALLQATNNLAGFVLHGISRTNVWDIGDVDNLTVSHLQVDGNQANRRCYGYDNVGNTIDDNWGSERNECGTNYDDPWCSPGSISLCGATDLGDPTQDYINNPSDWSTGFLVNDVLINNTECGTALGFCNAGGTIQNTTIINAGDHVHRTDPACAQTDPDEPIGAWSDGITFEGPGHTIDNNTVVNASDVGIVHFGGKDTKITNNTIESTTGNYGMFAGIAIHPWGFGDISGGEVSGNTVTNNSDYVCGGIHAGINLGTHMWNGGCVGYGVGAAFGNPNECAAEPLTLVTNCVNGQPCQIWAHVATGQSYTLKANSVTGAQLNYLVEGLNLAGTGELVESGNESYYPHRTDWESSQYCDMGGKVDMWAAYGFVAHHPTLPGWTDIRVHCER